LRQLEECARLGAAQEFEDEQKAGDAAPARQGQPRTRYFEDVWNAPEDQVRLVEVHLIAFSLHDGILVSFARVNDERRI
jgi:hypothetical protein